MPARAGLTGGTEAPSVGLGQAAPPRRSGYRERPRKARAQQVAEGIAQRRAVQTPQRGVAQAAQPQLGRQLTRLVGSGKIDQGQAEHTAKERALLEWAYGKDWRKQVGGGRGNVRLAREALAQEPENPLVRANYEALMAQRNKLLQHAMKLRGITQEPTA